MLIDSARATEAPFTPAFVRSDFTYLVPAGSALRNAADVDWVDGIRSGRADMHRPLRLYASSSKLSQFTPIPTTQLFEPRPGNAKAFASIREILLQYSPQPPGYECWTTAIKLIWLASQSLKVMRRGLLMLSEFLDEMKRSGSMQRLVSDAGLRGVEVAMPK
jgi:hypothetical protein